MTEARVPEPRKKSGVQYAITDDGLEIPVIDITHEAFDVSREGAEIEKHIAAFVAESERRARMPKWLQRTILPLILGRSVIGRGLNAGSGTYVAGIPTYLLKLGPDNLSESYAGKIDRRIAASLPALSMRFRLIDMARLLADGARLSLAARPNAPLRFINIAGGPCVDSMNALLLLRRENPRAIDCRVIRIHAFDLEASGAAFGERALAALRAEGAPLHGLDVALVHHRYDWKQSDALRAELEALDLMRSIVAVSSEGGLFEYASDAVVRSNLRVLHEATPDDAVVVGSTTSDGDIARLAYDGSRVPLVSRSIEAFDTLAASAGWGVDTRVERPLCRDVLMTKRRAPSDDAARNIQG